jgi:excisionase family DNA binding protein
MTKLTFEQLPAAIEILLEKVTRIEELLANDSGNISTKEMMSAKEAAELLDISMSSLYKMTHANEVPFYKPGGNKLYFKKEELMSWMLQHRIKSQAEIEKEAIDYVIKNPLKR